MRYFVTFLIGLGLVILVIIFLIRLIFGGGSPETPKAELLDYARTNTIMRLTIDGPVVADQDHRRIQIDVGDTANELRLITGYQGNITGNKTVNSNSEAYANFLRAIDLQGYTLGDTSKALADDRGYCPQGNRYIFEIIDGSETKQRFWTTTCDGAKTFKGQSETIVGLFKSQIPQYQEVTGPFGLQ